MSKTGRALVAAGAAALLCLALPGSAQAATGEFLYQTQPGNVPHILNNPVDDQCHQVGSADGLTENYTNRDALLYAGGNCTGDVVEVLNPGQPDDAAQFGSVMFVR